MRVVSVLLGVIALALCKIGTVDSAVAENVRITGVSPRYGSVNGAVRLTITGSGFSADQFNFGEGRSNLGNKVKLVSETQTYDCDIYRDGTTKDQVQCYTQRMPQDKYWVRVSVDGEQVPLNQHCGHETSVTCTFNAHSGWSPYISSLSPRAGPPGSVIQINGRIFTTRYGSNVDESENGKTEKILRSYVGGQLCEFRNVDGAADELYGIKLNKETSDWGYMKCKMKGSYVGNHNVSFILEAPYGRSNPAGDAYRVTALDKITMFQTYAEIYNVTPSTGSNYGGTELTINGRYFETTNAPARVDIAGTACKVTQVEDNRILCVTEPKPSSSASLYQGNRGAKWEFWNSTTNDDFQSWINMSDPVDTLHLDEMQWVDEAGAKLNWYMFKLTSFFIPPRDGGYRFYIKSDDDSALFLGLDGTMDNMTKIASLPKNANSYKYSSQVSEKYMLQGQKPYPLVHVTREKNGDSSSNVAVLASKTELTGSRAATNVRAEVQTVYTTSDVYNEIQSVTLTNWKSQTKREEVQRLTVTSDNLPYTSFRFGYGGVYTAPLSGTSSALTVQSELNDLPSISPNSVSVSKKDVSGATQYDVTFKSDLGDFEMLDAILDENENRANATLAITERTKGKSSMKQFALRFGNATTTPISVTEKAQKIEDAVKEIFNVRCPSFLSSPKTRVAFNQGFEKETKYWESGKRTTDEEPFCGTTSLKNPTFLFREHSRYDSPIINLLVTGQLCYAYKGKFQGKVYVDYDYKLAGEAAFKRWAHLFYMDIPEALEWKYICIDVKTLLLAKHKNGVVTDTKLKRLFIYKDPASDVYIDNVLICGNEPTTDVKGVADFRRLRPPMWIIKDITVKGNADEEFTIEMSMKNCPHNLPHFSLLGAQEKETTNDEITFDSSTWRSGATVKVNKTQAASPPVGDTFDLILGNNTLSNIPAGITESDLKSLLETLPGVGVVSVVRTGTCAAYAWKVTWQTAPGDQPEITMVGDRLTGSNVSYGVVNDQDGGIMFDPIPGDLLRRIHNEPQVIVDINKIPSACSGNCEFNWDDAATPTLTGISPSTGSNRASTVLTLTGTGFSTSSNDNRVVIGGEACDVTSSTATEIQCNVGRGPAGEHEVVLTIAFKGLAGHIGGAKTFTYEFNIDGISPDEGSLAGGTHLVISGTGFGQNVTAQVGGSNCEMTSYNYSAIVCTTPSGSAGAVDVEVGDGSNSATSGTQFNYRTNLTPTVTSLDKTTVSVEGGDNITIAGTGFGSDSSSDSVKVGNKVATVVSYTDTEIVATVPKAAPGKYTLKVSVGEKGYADTTTNSIAKIDYDLSVTNAFPTSGSMEGGTTLTLTGTGFPADTSEMSVMVGDKTCASIGGTETELTCKTPSAAILHQVDNLGVHPQHGDHYAWKPAILEVNVGDTIQWTWNAPEFTHVKYMVQQTTSATSNDPMAGGFDSGTQSQKGKYQYQFTTAGTYYYWSGYVDQYDTISLRGTITVVDNQATSKKIRLLLNGFDAIYNTGSGVSNPSDSSACPGITSDVDGCSETSPAAASSDFNFDYLTCRTPIVSSFSPNNGTSTDTITITGTGFSTTDCKNVVQFGDRACTVSSSSKTQIQCSLDAGNDTKVGLMMPLSVIVNNRGAALNKEVSDVNRHFILLPHVNSISPSQGSAKGGTPVTIQGGGFYGSVTVSIGLFDCTIKTLNYDEIVCETTAGAPATETVSVKVTEGGRPIEAECKSGPCEFTYSSALTPTVLSVSPTQIDVDGTVLSINGTKFGTNAGDVQVFLGDTTCSVLTLDDSSITCNASSPIVGQNLINVLISGKGMADSSSTVTVKPVIIAVNPSTGSIGGGTLVKVDGLGFKTDSTTIKVGNQNCLSVKVNPQSIECKTPKSTAGTAKIQVLSNAISYPSANYVYDVSATPTITSVSPTSGKSGDSITITGTGFSTSSSDMEVIIDGVACSVTGSTVTQVTCTLGVHSAGLFPIVVSHNAKGEADGNVDFTYTLTLTSISPSEGSFGGGQALTLTGVGFDSQNTTVLICDVPCKTVGTPSATQLTCTSPAKTLAGSNQACDVKVAVFNQDDTSSSGFTYKTTLTPRITNVSPRRGGTGGNTRLTITGSGFGNDANVVAVLLAGTACVKQTVSDTQVVCLTGSHKPSTQTKVELSVGTNGIATQDQADFEYIDVWSSPFSWNYNMPEEGDFVVIPSDMTILLDTDTPVLKMLLIDGGKLIFDEQDVELQAERILITKGGTLQIGTEEKPHQSKAIITLHGHPRSTELPIYGAKNIGVREGTLDLHGKDPGVVWTVLDSTVNAYESEITLRDPVPWQVGDFIAIASTSGRHSQSQNEMRQISGVKNGQKTLVLSTPVNFKHLGETVTLGSGHTLEARAEVGLLTRNILIRGSNNSQWNDLVAACPEGFDTGEFATQTCFQGRFGEEIGSDQYGAQIMLHATRPNEDLVKGRIENIEMTYAGQAFRIGRYAIHFHLNGDMQGNYVRGCAIHHSFNRAVNIHGTNYINVENNVVYDIMGGAIFLEDGVEIGNIFQYNLAIFVKGSSSLQNDDITPAAYWLTNANNTVRHNHAAGGTHFGFWYRMHKHPDGPSYDSNYCPQHVPLGIFENNTVHAHGWFGLWIFKEFYPMEGGGCKDNNPIAAKYYSLNAWNNEKGAEWVGVGAIQFIDFFLVNNEKAGIDLKLMSHSVSYSEERGGMVKGCTIVSGPETKGILDETPTKVGVIAPYGRGLLIKDITFVNFAGSGSTAFGVTQVDGKTKDNCGGFTYRTSGLTFQNSPNKIGWRWIHEAVYHDLDGTLTGIVNGKAIPTTGHLPNDKCTHNVKGMSVNSAVPGSVCNADVNFHRFSFNKAAPESLVSKNVSFTNKYGSTITEFKAKRVTHKEGWMALLVSGEDHRMEFVNAGHITNITYTGTIYDLAADQYLIISHNLTQRPDRFGIKEGVVAKDGASSMVSYADSNDGDWYFDQSTTMFSYIATGKASRKKRGLSPPESGSKDTDIKLRVYRCFFDDCVLPMDPNKIPPPEGRPENANYVYWDNATAWKSADVGFGGNNGDGTFGLPKEGDDVIIKSGDWVIVRKPIPSLGKLYVYGVLEFEYLPVNGEVVDHTLNCTHIIIAGGRLIMGWEKNRYTGNGQIVLRGDHLTPDMPLPNGPNLGAKALGVFGGLDLHGIERSVMWTRLQQTATKGSNTITLKEGVDWVVGDEIVIATTGFSAWETETMKITSKSANNRTLTLNATLSHTHIVSTVTTGQGSSVIFGAEVGLLTHNIKIIGAPYKKFYEQSFGARVLVGKFNQDGVEYTGYARLSFVEFYHAGQEGWTDDYDPRFSIAFLDTGAVSDIRPSYLTKCSFHHNFAPAIGVFNVINLTVTDNVIYHTVGASIQEGGINNVYRNNLVTLMRFPGTFNGRDEGRMFWEAAIDVHRATGVVLTDNVVAGSERTGFQIDGEPCDGSTEGWSGNVIHSTLVGVEMWPEDGLPGCSKISGITVFKAWDTGIYFQTRSNIIVDGVTIADSFVGIFPMVIGPNAAAHSFGNSYVKIQNSIIIGSTADFDCSEKLTNSDRNIFWSENSRPWRSPSGGKVGVSFTTFSCGSNEAPSKPFYNIMAYNTIGGLMTITDTTFVGFQSKCTGKKDVIITTSPKNDDAQHPIRTKGITLFNVDNDNKIFFHRANVGAINPSDCVDMECDGMKKAMIDDLDGTFIGSKGTYIAESEFAWDGDSRRGLGDYRIPKTLLTDTSGNRIAVNTIAPNKGIIRDGSCTYKSGFQAYECHNLDYEMIMLESMDSDTETRRLSPVAILGDGYLDLVNGPQDHGWCFGYTCQERLSTFPIIIATGKYYILHYTGTSPQNTRIRMLNSNETQAFVVGIFYSLPQRLDVFINDVYVTPTNAELNSDGQQILKAPTTSGQYLPVVASDPTGTNYFHKTEKTLHVLVRGPTAVDIRMSPLLIIGFSLPAMSVEDFFGANMVNNLAVFLGIPANKIKVAKAVPATSRRRKRSAATSFEVELEISNPPGNGSSNATGSGNSDDLSYDQLQNITSAVINGVQLGTLGSVLNVTILDFDITEPVPAPSSSAWKTVTVTSSSGESYNLKIQIPSTMKVDTEPVGMTEGNPLTVHPVLYMNDAQNAFVKQLGSKVSPWKVTASLKMVDDSSSLASLSGDVTVDFIQGWANFTNLIVSHSGKYKLDFQVTYPSEAASRFTAQSAEFEIADRNLAGSIVKQDNTTTVGESFSVWGEIVDADTAAKVTNISWKGHTWTCQASLYLPDISPGLLQGVTTVPVNLTSGIAALDDLKVTAQGSYFVELSFVSNPADYNFKVVSAAIEALPVDYTAPVVEVSNQVRIRFIADYNSTLTNRMNYFEAAVKNKIMASIDSTNITIKDMTLTEGSILATFTMEGATVKVTSALEALYRVVALDLFTFTFFGVTMKADGSMWVDNEVYIRALPTSQTGLGAGALAAIITCSVVLIIVLIILVIFFKKYTDKKNKTAAVTSPSNPNPYGNLLPAGAEERGDLAPPARTANFQPQWDDPTTTNDEANPALPQGEADDFQEINLAKSEGTRPTPLPDLLDDDDDDDVDGADGTGSTPSGSGTNRSRPQSRPPSKPSMVWDADFSDSAPLSGKKDPFKDANPFSVQKNKTLDPFATPVLTGPRGHDYSMYGKPGALPALGPMKKALQEMNKKKSKKNKKKKKQQATYNMDLEASSGQIEGNQLDVENQTSYVQSEEGGNTPRMMGSDFLRN